MICGVFSYEKDHDEDEGGISSYNDNDINDILV